ncbi:hypothetical protein CEXT_587821 [Caerostris extrusa]|uniref:Secreted protein n=1 Tax=Caerostris extrusa TaxID=172846 RepID=A0AAV4NSN3_CAEEX|nr:hypothetical protein CEXT_587821 [Caerostris extrusa]
MSMRSTLHICFRPSVSCFPFPLDGVGRRRSKGKEGPLFVERNRGQCDFGHRPVPKAVRPPFAHLALCRLTIKCARGRLIHQLCTVPHQVHGQD